MFRENISDSIFHRFWVAVTYAISKHKLYEKELPKNISKFPTIIQRKNYFPLKPLVIHFPKSHFSTRIHSEHLPDIQSLRATKHFREWRKKKFHLFHARADQTKAFPGAEEKEVERRVTVNLKEERKGMYRTAQSDGSRAPRASQWSFYL